MSTPENELSNEDLAKVLTEGKQTRDGYNTFVNFEQRDNINLTGFPSIGTN